MQFGLIISVLLHAAILGWAVFTIHTQQELRVAEPEAVAVDLVTPSEVTKIRQGVRTAKQMEAEAKEAPKPEISKKESPKPTPVVTPKPEPPPESKKEEAKPEPKPEPPKEVAKAEPKPEPKVEPPKPEAKDPIAEQLATDKPDPALEQARLEEKLREEQRKAEEKKKHEEQLKKAAELKKKKEEEAKKRREAEAKRKKEEEARKLAEAKKKEKSFDEQMREMQALLNKAPDQGAPIANKEPETPSKNKGPVLGAKEGRDQALTASELAVLKQIIRSCVGPKWFVMAGGADAQNVIVKIKVHFNPDGRLARAAEVINPQNTPLFLAASESALRAVQACEPYPLPSAKYDSWKETVLTLDPRDMY